MDSARTTRSPMLVLVLAVAAHLVASLLRDRLIPSSLSGLALSLDVSLLYLIVLMPGVIVGWMLRRNVLEWGFLAGLLSETSRQGLSMLLQWLELPPVPELNGPSPGDLAALVYTSLPSAFIGAAGGAAGWVLAIRKARLGAAPATAIGSSGE